MLRNAEKAQPIIGNQYLIFNQFNIYNKSIVVISTFHVNLVKYKIDYN